MKQVKNTLDDPVISSTNCSHADLEKDEENNINVDDIHYGDGVGCCDNNYDEDNGNDDDSDYIDDVDIYDSQCMTQVIPLLDGLFEHLTSISGGSKSASAANTLINRMATFISFVSKEIHDDGKTVCSLEELARVHHTKIASYCQHLLDSRGFNANTVLSHLDDFLTSITWYVLYRPRSSMDTLEVNACFLLPWQSTIKHLRRAYKKISVLRNSRNTIEKELENFRLPKGGLAELQSIVESKMTWARSLTAICFKTKDVFVSFMQLLIGAMFATCVQGRY